MPAYETSFNRFIEYHYIFTDAATPEHSKHLWYEIERPTKRLLTIHTHFCNCLRVCMPNFMSRREHYFVQKVHVSVVKKHAWLWPKRVHPSFYQSMY